MFQTAFCRVGTYCPPMPHTFEQRKIRHCLPQVCGLNPRFVKVSHLVSNECPHYAQSFRIKQAACPNSFQKSCFKSIKATRFLF